MRWKPTRASEGTRLRALAESILAALPAEIKSPEGGFVMPELHYFLQVT